MDSSAVTGTEPGERMRVDLLVAGAAALATARGNEPRVGAALGAVDIVEHGAVAVRGDSIVAVGPEAELRARCEPERVLDARGGLLVPGFVDAHTHPVFFGTREEEFEMRTRGATYVEISQAGGGILSSVRGVRAASPEQLRAQLEGRLDRFLALGTTTVEAKSGYGLSLEDELKSLQAIADAGAGHAVRPVPTFLGAHDFPPEYRERRAAYVDHVVQDMLPAVAQSGLAEYCDVFTEDHVFGLDDTRRIADAAKALGLGLRLHVDQLTPLGGAQLASELGVASADHLENISAAGIDALAASGTIAVLCPLVPLYLRQDIDAPGRRMIDAGVPVALATDFNPGSCNTQSLPEVCTWAALRMRMSAAECLTAATLNAACSLGRGSELGTLEVGKRADIAVLDFSDLRFLCYEFGWNPVRAVVAGGCVAHERADMQRGVSKSKH